MAHHCVATEKGRERRGRPTPCHREKLNYITIDDGRWEESWEEKGKGTERKKIQ